MKRSMTRLYGEIPMDNETVPVRSPASPVCGRTKSSCEASSGKCKAPNNCTLDFHILVADDNEFLRHMFERIIPLVCPNSVCHTACNGAEAIEMFRAICFDLVFLDLKMPDLCGVSAAQSLRKLEKELNRDPTPLYAISAYEVKCEWDRCESAGFDGFLCKPFGINEIGAVVRQFCVAHA